LADDFGPFFPFIELKLDSVFQETGRFGSQDVKPMLFRWDQSSLLVHTPAKLNLFLEVLNKRPDGFHELETVMVKLGIYDTLRISPSNPSENSGADIRLRISGRSTAGIPSGPENLVIQAATLLKTHTSFTGGAEIHLRKRIPVQAGLAGGSSDAAAALAGLNQFWKLGLSLEGLRELAARLGSDVPFFLNPSRSAVCRGRGEVIEPFYAPLGWYFVVVKPESGLSTPEVFRNWKPTDSTRSAKPLVEELRRGPRGLLARWMHNALEAPAAELNADVSRLRDEFSKAPVLGHMMSGSGTAYFGICRHRRQAEFAAARLSSRRIGSVIVARSLL
jgi:4-diphosphocytidyl-2-C-methyl-D-erythritol kinase